MAQFFFHFCDAGQVEADEIGVEFASAEQAYLEAVATARALWPELLAARRDPERCAFEITDADGAILFRVPFGELLDGCRPALSGQPASREMHELLRDTHSRAYVARQQVRDGLDQVHQTLQDMSQLLDQLARYEAKRTGLDPVPLEYPPRQGRPDEA